MTSQSSDSVQEFNLSVIAQALGEELKYIEWVTNVPHSSKKGSGDSVNRFAHFKLCLNALEIVKRYVGEDTTLHPTLTNVGRIQGTLVSLLTLWGEVNIAVTSQTLQSYPKSVEIHTTQIESSTTTAPSYMQSVTRLREENLTCWDSSNNHRTENLTCSGRYRLMYLTLSAELRLHQMLTALEKN